jgi:ElaB/YqjD/DUF883 family membrane-anchored ribosome-binding protein
MESTYDGTLETVRGNKRGKTDLIDKSASQTTSTEFKNFVADVEDVVKRVADVSDVDVARVRAKIQAALTSAGSGLADGIDTFRVQAQKVAKQTDEYVHDSPWQALGIGAALAALIGVSIGFLAARR